MFSVFSRYLPRVLAAITSGFVSNQTAVWAAPTGSNLAVLLQTAGSQMACIWVPFCALCVKQRLDLSDEKTVHQIRENLGTPNKPLEWTGHHQLSTGPAQIHCLPLRGSVLWRFTFRKATIIIKPRTPGNESSDWQIGGSIACGA